MKMHRDKTNLIAEELGDSLIQAVIAGDLPAVRELIDSGADINFSNMNGVTPLMAASQWRRTKIIEFLLANGTSTSPVDRLDGRTALMSACLSGSPECVEMLLCAGADVSVRDAYSMTALMLAAITGKIQMVKHLVEAGAEIDARSENGFTAIDWAEKWGQRTVASYLSATNIQKRGRGKTGKRASENSPFMNSENKP